MVNQQFVPEISHDSVKYITSKLLERGGLKKKFFVIEYGSGYSTIFFTNFLSSNDISTEYSSAEMSLEWYSEILKYYPGGSLTKNTWTIKDYNNFIKTKPQNIWQVPEECARLKRQQRKMRSPKYFIKFLLTKSKFWFNAKYHLKLTNLNFDYYYIFEGFRDQFGESPNKNKYIKNPIENLLGYLDSGKDCHAVFIIDGGPRADIVNEIFSLLGNYKNLTVDIFLLEAYRGYYKQILSSRAGGNFIKADKNETLDGRIYLKEQDIKKSNNACGELMGASNLKEALEKELWHFTNLF